MGQITVSKCYTEDGIEIEGLKVIEPKVFGDARGYFYEVYNYNDYAAAGIDMQFVQDNQSGSKNGVIRGLHFQKQFPQDKLVRAARGTVFDVAVDLREGSKTFGKWFGVELSEENKKQFFIPKNFAHGFVVLSDTAEFAYKCTDFIIRMMRAALYGMTLRSELSGRYRREWSLFSRIRILSGEHLRSM